MSGVIKISKDALTNIVKSIISSGRMVIDKQTLNAGVSIPLVSNTVFFAIALIHGDGDPEVQLMVRVGNDVTTVAGNEPAIAVAANELLEISATNTDTVNQHNTPTVEVIFISVGITVG
jgi:hypothetical protein